MGSGSIQIHFLTGFNHVVINSVFQISDLTKSKMDGETMWFHI